MKIKHAIIILILLASTAAAQNTAPGGIGQLYDAVEQMTKQMAEMKKIQEDMPLKFEQQFTRWISLTVFGISVFMTILYSFTVFIDHIRQRKMKKSRETHIKELSKELETLKLQYIVDIEMVHEIASEAYLIRELLAEKTGQKPESKIRGEKIGIIYLGVFIGVMIMVAVMFIGGVL